MVPGRGNCPYGMLLMLQLGLGGGDQSPLPSQVISQLWDSIPLSGKGLCSKVDIGSTTPLHTLEGNKAYTQHPNL